MPTTIFDRIIAIEDSWVATKYAVAGAGLSYDEVDRLDVFEFFTLLREVNKRSAPK